MRRGQKDIYPSKMYWSDKPWSLNALEASSGAIHTLIYLE